jgi:hypothetical protein
VPPLSSLDPPQRAVLALVLEKGKAYEEIAGLLHLDAAAVRKRAHQALDALGPTAGAKPAARHRAAIGDYLLGQEPDRTPATLAYLEGSVAGREWARAVAAELGGLAAVVPEIPPEPPEPESDEEAGGGSPPESAAPTTTPDPLPPEAGPNDESSPLYVPDFEPAPASGAVSRRGGALLILGALVAVAAVVAAVLLLRGGPTHRPAPVKPAATPTARIVAQITLKASAGVRATGLGAVIQRGTQRVIAIAAARLAPTSARLAYGVWLLNAASDFQLVGFIPQVKADGRVSVAAPLPAAAARFHGLVVTREAGRHATRPGPVLLRGTFPAGALG